MPVTFAIVRPPRTSNWVTCALVGVSNALPYPLHVGIATSEDADPETERVTTIEANGHSAVPIPPNAHKAKQSWLKVRLTTDSHWSVGGELCLDPSRETVFENRALKLAFQQSGVDYKLLLKVTESRIGVARARLIKSVHHFTVFCPHVIHNSTGRADLDIINSEANGPNLATSTWRPSDAMCTGPALFAPYEADIDTVHFVVKNRASMAIPLFSLADSAQKVSMSLGNNGKIKGIDTLIQRKMAAGKISDPKAEDGSLDVFITSTFQWNGGSMLFREIFLRPK
jgi:hypothetical protein